MKILKVILSATTFCVLMNGSLAIAADNAATATTTIEEGSTTEQIMANAYFFNLGKLADALENVTDQASAAEAATAIRELGVEMRALEEKYDFEIGEQQMTTYMLTRQDEFIALQQRLNASFTRIATSAPQLMQKIIQEINAAGFRK